MVYKCDPISGQAIRSEPMTNRKLIDDEPIFDGVETFPAIDIAETVDSLIEARGIQAAAEHAASVTRAANAMKEPEVAADWDEVYRLIIARRGM
jgi:hypothetical protein